MTNEHTLLSFIARRYIAAREDVATDELGFILNRSEVARKALTDILHEQVPNILPVATVKTNFPTLPEAFLMWRVSTRPAKSKHSLRPNFRHR